MKKFLIFSLFLVSCSHEGITPDSFTQLMHEPFFTLKYGIWVDPSEKTKTCSLEIDSIFDIVVLEMEKKDHRVFEKEKMQDILLNNNLGIEFMEDEAYDCEAPPRFRCVGQYSFFTSTLMVGKVGSLTSETPLIHESIHFFLDKAAHDMDYSHLYKDMWKSDDGSYNDNPREGNAISVEYISFFEARKHNWCDSE